MEKSLVQPLEQFLLLAKTARGAAIVELIKQVLEAPGVYVFGELLDMPNIQSMVVESSPEALPYWRLLHLFAFGTYADYKENKAQLPEMTPTQTKKLKHLTIVSLANKSKCIPYSVLLQELDISSLRGLEDLIIEVIYANVVRGKLDQKRQCLEIDYTIGRDIRMEPAIIGILQEWCDNCELTLANIEEQVKKANTQRDHHTKIKTTIETEVANIKKTLKAQAQEYDESMAVDSAQPVVTQPEKPAKKSSKTKGLRGSGGKFWSKSSS
ncbi:PREDICTED: COP9 signalosome complex subunit 7b-like [Priapulus caudatus]|uniref:COP9 signalosome complex subunit 7b-like n=1 Tax=Priapulus caudatus TaxID=37621 RepID=A0ABM1EJH4_PRICU|nr:PREDICTED: COP9 signalosome complex subunit 7b-like [Priapulus caudatus]XP_014672347.1 PREDICTED: COP9 signalosome complex subunit 7b-like [Priapulus caudatus]